jgi:hypothetical protein
MQRSLQRRQGAEGLTSGYGFPLKPSHMDGEHQFPLQISKSRRIKGFGENVGQLSLSVYVSHLNVTILYMIS